MRILIVNSYYYPEIEGGAEYSVKMQAETLTKNGHNVSVICTAAEESQENIEGVDVYRIKSKCIVRTKECYKKNTIIRKAHRLLDIYNPFNFGLLNKLIKKIKPEVIHSNGLYDISPVIWKVAKANKIPVVHTLRDYCLICEHSNMLKKKTGEACPGPSLLCKFYRKINAFQTRNVDVVTAPSQFTLDTVCNADLFSKAKKTVVFNATDIDIEEVRRNVERRSKEIPLKKTFTYVFVGALVEFKGIKWLVDCFEKIKNQDLRLLICGKGELKDYIIDASKRDSRIEYRGFLGQKELRDVLSEADVLICPSLWNEPFGRVVLDAYQAGIPVIATNVGALSSIVKDGETGIVVQLGSDEEFMHALQLVNDDKNLYEIMLTKLNRISGNFSLQAQCINYLKIYMEQMEG